LACPEYSHLAVCAGQAANSLQKSKSRQRHVAQIENPEKSWGSTEAQWKQPGRRSREVTCPDYWPESTIWRSRSFDTGQGRNRIEVAFGLVLIDRPPPPTRYWNCSMFGIGQTEILIFLVIAMVLFGSARLPTLMRNLGRSATEFKKGMREEDSDVPTDSTNTDKKN
jgi:sec-independent protein translocase protein TatA